MHWHDYRFTKRSELFVSFTIRVVKIKIEKLFLIACAVIIFIFSLIITFFDAHGESFFYSLFQSRSSYIYGILRGSLT